MTSEQPEEKKPKKKGTDFCEKDFEELTKIEDGGEATTYRGFSPGFGEVCVKVFNTAQKGKRSEIDIILKLNGFHPNVVRFYGHFLSTPTSSVIFNMKSIGYVMEFMAGVIYSKEEKYNEEQIHWWIVQAARGLNYLHSVNIIHKDVKPKNFLLDANKEILKISDFGLSKTMEHVHTHLFVRFTIFQEFRRGTCRYMAPELLREEQYSFPVDIYAFGISIWEMFKRAEPFQNMSFITIATGVSEKTNLRPNLDGFDPEICQLLEKTWYPDQAKRCIPMDLINFSMSKTKNRSISSPRSSTAEEPPISTREVVMKAKVVEKFKNLKFLSLKQEEKTTSEGENSLVLKEADKTSELEKEPPVITAGVETYQPTEADKTSELEKDPPVITAEVETYQPTEADKFIQLIADCLSDLLDVSDWGKVKVTPSTYKQLFMTEFKFWLDYFKYVQKPEVWENTLNKLGTFLNEQLTKRVKNICMGGQYDVYSFGISADGSYNVKDFGKAGSNAMQNSQGMISFIINEMPSMEIYFWNWKVNENNSVFLTSSRLLHMLSIVNCLKDSTFISKEKIDWIKYCLFTNQDKDPMENLETILNNLSDYVVQVENNIGDKTTDIVLEMVYSKYGFIKFDSDHWFHQDKDFWVYVDPLKCQVLFILHTANATNETCAKILQWRTELEKLRRFSKQKQVLKNFLQANLHFVLMTNGPISACKLFDLVYNKFAKRDELLINPLALFKLQMSGVPYQGNQVFSNLGNNICASLANKKFAHVHFHIDTQIEYGQFEVWWKQFAGFTSVGLACNELATKKEQSDALKKFNKSCQGFTFQNAWAFHSHHTEVAYDDLTELYRMCMRLRMIVLRKDLKIEDD